jgi:hypothetical protein
LPKPKVGWAIRLLAREIPKQLHRKANFKAPLTKTPKAFPKRHQQRKNLTSKQFRLISAQRASFLRANRK